MSNSPLANWNGEQMPLDEVQVSVLDRGFLFGDAVYEVIRVYNGKPFLFEEHIQRLDRNLAELRIAADARQIADRTLETLQASGLAEALIYIQVTRGAGPRMHRFPDPPLSPNILVFAKEFPDPYAAAREQGVRAWLTEDLRWKRCDIKSVNLLANCLAAQEAYESGCTEALFVEPDGALTEGSHTSLFGVRDGAVLTAPLGENILPGITRGLVLNLAEQAGIPVHEELLKRDRLNELDELFLTGTTSEVMPVVEVLSSQRSEQSVPDGSITIGSGQRGPVVERLQAEYRVRVEG
jgi:D-alanine transaminase